MNSCLPTDPGWRYKVRDPYHEDTYYHKYGYRSYALNFELAANDSALSTFVALQITTPCDSIEIYPTQAYIKSPHFTDTTLFPIYTNIESSPKDSIDAGKHKKINIENFSGPYFLHKEENLFVKLIFRSFAAYDKRNRRAPFTSEKSDFIFNYDISNNKYPPTFTFTPDTTKKQ